jgi:Ca2+-binding RTX toxin-like protein
MATQNGGSGPDTLIGTIFSDILRGNGGNDLLVGKAGFDQLTGGDGEDILEGGSSGSGIGADESLEGEEGNDILRGQEGDDLIEGGAGDDLLAGGRDDDRMNGGDGIDTVSYAAADEKDKDNGGANVNLLEGRGFRTGGRSEFDTILNVENVIGTAFADNLIGDNNDNVLEGRNGNDGILANGGNDIVLGGSGADTIDGAAGNDAIASNNGNDAVSGGSGNDVIATAQGSDTLRGGSGKDTLIGGAEADLLDGDSSTDTARYAASSAAVEVDLDAGTGSGGDAEGDTLVQIENLDGSTFADTLTGDDENNVIQGGRGADSLDGGLGIDVLSYESAITGVTVKLFDGTALGLEAEGDLFSGFERLRGSQRDDLLAGDGNINTLQGLGGDDTLNGFGGDDAIEGDAGNDDLRGGNGSDRYLTRVPDGSDDSVNDAAGDADTLVFINAADIVTSVRLGDDLKIFLTSGTITVIGHFTAGRTVEFAEVAGEQLVLADGNIGGSSGGIISGTDENDYLNGGGGGDILFGAGGNDHMVGGTGDDTLDGGEGRDVLRGGRGNDTFKFSSDRAADRVTDFTVAEDSVVFDAKSFGIPEGTAVANLVHFGERPEALGPGFVATEDGTITFYRRLWDDADAGEVVARLDGNLIGLSAEHFALS